MSVKNELRKKLKSRRRELADKAEKDSKIAELFLNSTFYKNADLILFYAALKDEINTDKCIENALADGKGVALPVCSDKNGNMKYYLISSLGDLVNGSFSIREPDISKCREATDFTNSLCVVPAIAFDKKGYRLGYGKGYYDRFLQNYISFSVGLCYNELLEASLPSEEHDIPVSCVISEKGIILCKEE